MRSKTSTEKVCSANRTPLPDMPTAFACFQQREATILSLRLLDVNHREQK